MGNVQAIAREKIEADLQRRMLELPAAIRTLQQDLAAKGMLKSGRMLKGVLQLAQKSLEDQGLDVAAHYIWAIRTALSPSSQWAEDLAREGAQSLEPLLARGNDAIVHACKLADSDKLVSRLVAHLDSTPSSDSKRH